MGISQYTFIKKERRAEWDRIPEQHLQEERLLLWQGDREDHKGYLSYSGKKIQVNTI